MGRRLGTNQVRALVESCWSGQMPGTLARCPCSAAVPPRLSPAVAIAPLAPPCRPSLSRIIRATGSTPMASAPPLPCRVVAVHVTSPLVLATVSRPAGLNHGLCHATEEALQERHVALRERGVLHTCREGITA